VFFEFSRQQLTLSTIVQLRWPAFLQGIKLKRSEQREERVRWLGVHTKGGKDLCPVTSEQSKSVNQVLGGFAAETLPLEFNSDATLIAGRVQDFV
jgi:hypothetical protein